jgi:hypothetical protein
MDSRGLHHQSSSPAQRALGLELGLTPLLGSVWVLQEEPLFFVLAQQVRPVGLELEELVRLMQRMRLHPLAPGEELSRPPKYYLRP